MTSATATATKWTFAAWVIIVTAHKQNSLPLSRHSPSPSKAQDSIQSHRARIKDSSAYIQPLSLQPTSTYEYIATRPRHPQDNLRVLRSQEKGIMPKKRARQASTASKAATLADDDRKSTIHNRSEDEADGGEEAIGGRQSRKGLISRFTSFLAPKPKKRKTSHPEIPIASSSTSAAGASSSSSSRTRSNNDDNISRTDSAALLALVQNQNTPFRRAINAVIPTDPSQLADSPFPGVAAAARLFQQPGSADEAGPSSARTNQPEAMAVDEPESSSKTALADEILAAAATPHRRRQRSRIIAHSALASPTSASEKVEDSEPEADDQDEEVRLNEASFSFDSLSHPPSELAMGTPTKRLRSGNMAMAPEDSSHIYYSGHHSSAVAEGSRRRARSRSAGPSKGKRRGSSVGRHLADEILTGQHDGEDKEEAEEEESSSALKDTASKNTEAARDDEAQEENEEEKEEHAQEEEEEEPEVAAMPSPPLTRLAKRIAVEEASQEDSPSGIRRSARLAGEEVEPLTLSDAETSQHQDKGKEEDSNEAEDSVPTPEREREVEEEPSPSPSKPSSQMQSALSTSQDVLSPANEMVLLRGHTRPKRVYGHGRKIGIGSADARVRSTIRTRRSQTVEADESESKGEVDHAEEDAVEEEEGPVPSSSMLKDEHVSGYGRKIGVKPADARMRSTMRTRRSQTVEAEIAADESESKVEVDNAEEDAGEEEEEEAVLIPSSSVLKDEHVSEEEEERDDEDQAEVSALALSPSKPKLVTSIAESGSSPVSSPQRSKSAKKNAKRKAKARQKSANLAEGELEALPSSELAVEKEIGGIGSENKLWMGLSSPQIAASGDAAHEASSSLAEEHPQISAVAPRKSARMAKATPKSKGKGKGKGKAKQLEAEPVSDAEMGEGGDQDVRPEPISKKLGTGSGEVADAKAEGKESSPETSAFAIQLPAAPTTELVAKDEPEEEEEERRIAVPVLEGSEPVLAYADEQEISYPQLEPALPTRSSPPVQEEAEQESTSASKQISISPEPESAQSPINENIPEPWPMQHPFVVDGSDSMLPPGSTSARQAEADAFVAEAANGGGIPAGLPVYDTTEDQISALESVAVPTRDVVEREPVAVVPEEDGEDVLVPGLGGDGVDLSMGTEERIRFDGGEVISLDQAEPEPVPVSPASVSTGVEGSEEAVQEPRLSQAETLVNAFSPLESTPPTSSSELTKQQQQKPVQVPSTIEESTSAAKLDGRDEVIPPSSSATSTTSEEDELGSRASAIRQRKLRAERNQKQREEDDEGLSAETEPAVPTLIESPAVEDGPSAAQQTEQDVGEGAFEEGRLTAIAGTGDGPVLTDEDVAIILEAAAAEHPSEIAVVEDAQVATEDKAVVEEEEQARQADLLMEDVFEFPGQENDNELAIASQAAELQEGERNLVQTVEEDGPVFEMEQVPSQTVTIDASALSNPTIRVPELNLPTGNADLIGSSSSSQNQIPAKNKGKSRALESEQRSMYEPLQIFDDSMAVDEHVDRDGLQQQQEQGPSAAPGGAVIAADEDAEDQIIVPTIDYRNLYPSLPALNGRMATNSPLGDEEKENYTLARSSPRSAKVGSVMIDGQEVIDMTGVTDEEGEEGEGYENGGVRDRTGQDATVSHSNRMTTPPTSHRPAGTSNGPLTPRSRMMLALSPGASPGPGRDGHSQVGDHPYPSSQQPRSSFVFGPIGTSQTALEDAQRDAEMRERVSRGEFLPLDRKKARASSRAQRIAYAVSGLPEEEEEMEEEYMHEAHHRVRDSAQYEANLLFEPPRTALGAQPWSYISAPSGALTLNYNSPSRPLHFDTDYTVYPESSFGGSASRPTNGKRRAGRNSVGSEVGNTTRGSAGGRGARKSGAMVGRASGIGSILPMGHDDYKHRIAAKREQQLLKLMAKHYEAMRREDSKLKKDDFMGLLRKGYHQMKAQDTSPTKKQSVKSDEHYMEEFMKELRLRAQVAQSQRIPIPAHRLKHYEKLRKDQKRRTIRALGVLGRPPLPAALTPEQKEVVEQLFRMTGTIKQFTGGSVADRDLACLKPGLWLNDESINMYGLLIIRRSEKAIAERARLEKEGKNDPRTNEEARKWHSFWNAHVFNSLFFVNLSKQGHEGVKRWTKRKGINLFTKDIVLIPVNCGNMHWTCGAINFRKKRIEYYDSMPGGRPFHNFFDNVRLYLRDEHKATYNGKEMDLSGWEDYLARDNPHQHNGYDCGVFTSQTIEQLSRRNGRTPYPSKPPYVLNPPVSGEGSDDGDEDDEDDDDEEELWNFSQENMPYLRRRMVYELGRAELLE
ncbi:hypothetical protein A4X09_0g4715 [Tilletia walkeri]|uniref:Ubiquitin-like protease family profile domain-containing protein n=1 Tax=Tilletia walkeri TaxID=117179 RepID=A0A8X7N8V2_9BASI|nr:hypothetical protein A4X09_0g4715 [Tilletia walkeri]